MYAKSRKTKYSISNRQRLTVRPRLLTALRLRGLVISLTVMLALAGFVYFNFAVQTHIAAYSPGDYRSRQSGYWEQTSTWETYNGNSWKMAEHQPDGQSKITICHAHVIISNDKTIKNNLVIEKGGQIIFTPSQTPSVTTKH